MTTSNDFLSCIPLNEVAKFIVVSIRQVRQQKSIRGLQIDVSGHNDKMETKVPKFTRPKIQKKVDNFIMRFKYNISRKKQNKPFLQVIILQSIP